MPEPTRYDCHETLLNLDKLPQGKFVLYTDYAALRQLAEAVVKGFRSPGIIECSQAIERLEDHLK